MSYYYNNNDNNDNNNNTHKQQQSQDEDGDFESCGVPNCKEIMLQPGGVISSGSFASVLKITTTPQTTTPTTTPQQKTLRVHYWSSSAANDGAICIKFGHIESAEHAFHSRYASREMRRRTKSTPPPNEHQRATIPPPPSSFLELAVATLCADFSTFVLKNPKLGGLVFREADGNLANLLEQHRPALPASEERANIFRSLGVCIQNCLDFFLDQGLVYCDWKSENILVRRLQRGEFEFKLSDFGSVQPAKKAIDAATQNPNNINSLFGSPHLSTVFETIRPSFFDDVFSARALFICSFLNAPPPWVDQIRRDRLVATSKSLIENELVK